MVELIQFVVLLIIYSLWYVFLALILMAIIGVFGFTLTFWQAWWAVVIIDFFIKLIK